jgi:hypothetical protein
MSIQSIHVCVGIAIYLEALNRRKDYRRAQSSRLINLTDQPTNKNATSYALWPKSNFIAPEAFLKLSLLKSPLEFANSKLSRAQLADKSLTYRPAIHVWTALAFFRSVDAFFSLGKPMSIYLSPQSSARRCKESKKISRKTQPKEKPPPGAELTRKLPQRSRLCYKLVIGAMLLI